MTVIAVLFIATSAAQAQSNFYVRAGATAAQNGTDWINAYSSLPDALVRGATYYIADGTYGDYTFDDAASGTTPITIKKATVTDHGIDLGWENSYGDGQAFFFGALIFSTNNWVFDGQTRNPDWRSGYGFKVRRASNAVRNTSSTIYLGIPAQSGVRDITLRYVEVEGSGDRTDTYYDRGIYSTSNSADITISQSYVHDNGNVPFLIIKTTNITVEYTWIARNQSTPNAHAEGVAVRDGTHSFRFRYNVMEDIEGTAYIATPTVGHPACAGTVQSNWYIYGNVFYRRGATSGGNVGNGILVIFDHQHQGDLYFVNNTIIGVNNGFVGFATGGGDGCGQNLTVRNNIWYGVSGTVGRSSNVQTQTWTHNAYFNTNTSDPDTNKQTGSTDIFISLSGYNFGLTTGTNSGVDLPSPFDRDLSGAIRGVDGVWDRGAFEFSGRRPPAAPRNVRIVRTN